MSCLIASSRDRFEAVDLALVADRPQLIERRIDRLDSLAAQFHDVAERRDAELGKQLLGQRAGRHADGRLAGDARSSTPRIEPRYFIAPVRSPWPGRGRGRSSSRSSL